jgi:hypothetical protein
MSLESIYGFWNPTPVVLVVLAVAAVLFALCLLFYRSRRRNVSNLPGFFRFYRPILARTVPPFAMMFWRGVSHFALAAAGKIRRIYTGDGQTYALYVLGYFLVIYFAGTGPGGVWARHDGGFCVLSLTCIAFRPPTGVSYCARVTRAAHFYRNSAGRFSTTGPPRAGSFRTPKR